MAETHFDRYGGWAMITGASQGIGFGFARALAAQGFPIALVARREDVLNDAAQRLEQEYGVETRTLVADMTDRSCISALQDFAADLDIGFFINNASYSIPGEFLSFRESQIQRQITINVEVIAMLSHHFGARMKARGRGALINVSSRTGEVAMPYYTMYCGTKAFMSTFTEALWYELKDHGVDVLALKPDQTASEGYLGMNPGEFGDGIQSVEECVAEGLRVLGEKASWLPWPSGRKEVSALRSMPLEDAIGVNGDGMRQVFGEQLQKS